MVNSKEISGVQGGILLISKANISTMVVLVQRCRFNINRLKTKSLTACMNKIDVLVRIGRRMTSVISCDLLFGSVSVIYPIPPLTTVVMASTGHRTWDGV